MPNAPGAQATATELRDYQTALSNWHRMMELRTRHQLAHEAAINDFIKAMPTDLSRTLSVKKIPVTDHDGDEMLSGDGSALTRDLTLVEVIGAAESYFKDRIGQFSVDEWQNKVKNLEIEKWSGDHDKNVKSLQMLVNNANQLVENGLTLNEDTQLSRTTTFKLFEQVWERICNTRGWEEVEYVKMVRKQFYDAKLAQKTIDGDDLKHVFTVAVLAFTSDVLHTAKVEKKIGGTTGESEEPAKKKSKRAKKRAAKERKLQREAEEGSSGSDDERANQAQTPAKKPIMGRLGPKTKSQPQETKTNSGTGSKTAAHDCVHCKRTNVTHSPDDCTQNPDGPNYKVPLEVIYGGKRDHGGSSTGVGRPAGTSKTRDDDLHRKIEKLEKSVALLAGKRKKSSKRKYSDDDDTSDSSSSEESDEPRKRKKDNRKSHCGSYAKRRRDDSDDDRERERSSRYADHYAAVARVEEAGNRSGNFAASGPRANTAFYDSGASITMSSDKRGFTKEIKKLRGVKITIADGKRIKAAGEAQYALKTRGGFKININKALYVPQCKSTLVSISQLAVQKDCLRIEFDRAGVYYVGKNETREKIGNLVNGLYVM